jgi:FkbM family methyltransferase
MEKNRLEALHRFYGGKLKKIDGPWEKLLFCIRVAGSLATFFQLTINSKLLARYQKNPARAYDPAPAAVAYKIHFYAVRQTIFMRTLAGDLRIFYEIFLERAYGLPPSLLTDPLVIIDAGSNIGMTALYFSALYPRARIYCLEPDPHNFQLLQRNLDLHKVAGRAILIEAALYDRDGRIGLSNAQWAYNSSVCEGGADQKTVAAISMDSLLDQFHLDRIDLLKIDIEGSEDKVFANATGWLKKVSVLLIEVHAPESQEPIMRRLAESGFSWQPWNRPGSSGSLFLASRTDA